ncbi:hypothetical protein [Winogradskyella ursingii]|uniref:hypothetical protein n=1 Tax=Winogradskyella ursingii TaxID=2686079 RepID=UPI0015CD38E6|nr:hypothetical protein [Winogradskyella ursingii]
MKKYILICFLFALSYNSFGQDTYTINGETIELKTEIDGKIDLLWNVIDNQYRYFVRNAEGTITELKNSKTPNGDFQEEYKATLKNITNGRNTDDVKLTLYSLRSFIDAYNTSTDATYTSTLIESKVKFRLGFSGGITNNPFVTNPDNIKAPLVGAELEIYETNLARHSGFLQLRHAFETDEFSYSATELSLGYRFRVVNTSKFSLYAQVKLATINFVNITFIDADDMEANANDTSFDLPLIFGIGTDIKVADNGYLTFILGELFAVGFDNQDNFPLDFSVGYKFNL